jgi:small GTP-binding protein
MGNIFQEDYIMTVGAGYASKTIELSYGQILKLQIWDLAGQSGFENLLHRYLAGSSALFLIFDITVRESFDNLDYWLKNFYDDPVHKSRPVIIIGNKIDLGDSLVSDEEIRDYITSIRQRFSLGDVFIDFAYTSAKTGENIESAFLMVSEQLTSHID